MTLTDIWLAVLLTTFLRIYANNKNNREVHNTR